jgi:serine O-acetyltransferase
MSATGGSVRELPSAEALAEVLNDLSAALFPTHYGRYDLTKDNIDYFVGHVLDRGVTVLTEQIRRGLLVSSGYEEANSLVVGERAYEISRALAERLPAIRSLLYRDIGAAIAGDPAATSATEVLLCYPGFLAVMYHRFAHELFDLGAPLVARLMAGIAHSKTGIDIHPGAEIGPGFFIDHGTGVVVGATAIIGRDVRLYQAVTLGARRFERDAHGSIVKGGARHRRGRGRYLRRCHHSRAGYDRQRLRDRWQCLADA